MPLLNYTTSIDAFVTVAKIQSLLAKAKARRISMDYNDHGHIIAMEFEVVTPNGIIPIRLPTDPKPVMEVLRQQKVAPRYLTEEHAINVAWRIVEDWVRAQMAILETRMVKMEQIFLPYIISKSGQTLFEDLEEKRFLLGAPDGEIVDAELGEE